MAGNPQGKLASAQTARANDGNCFPNLRDVPEFVSEDDAGSIPDDNLLILITGSQGEARSALSRVALDTHPRVVLGEGDTVIFSAG